MTFSASKKKESCNHEKYCGFSETVCVETDFQEHCRMKDAPIEDMPLLKSVKERVQRDQENEKKSH